MRAYTITTMFRRRRSAGRRRVLALALGVCTLAIPATAVAFLAPVALAGKPDRERLPPFEPFVTDPGELCPEAIAPEGVRIAWAGGNQVRTVFDNGKEMFTGRVSEQLTNVATGTSVVLDFHGMGEAIPQPDGSLVIRQSGTMGFRFLPGDVGPGDDGTLRLYLFTGNMRVVIGTDGVVNAFESAGKMEDTCAMIA